MGKKLVRLLIELAAIYAFVIAVLFLFQRHMEYFPDPRDVGLPKDAGIAEMQVLHVTTEDGLSLVAWFAPPKKKDGKVVVLFHGNGGSIPLRANKARLLIDHGYGVFFTEYRGYGGNPGDPTEEGLYRDARAGLSWLMNNGYKPSQFVIYGESLGTGVAVQMASEIHPKYLIIEAGFSSAADVAKGSMVGIPVDLLMRDRFDNASKIAAIKTNLLIVHGTADNIIPIEHDRKLFQAANQPKHFYTIHGGGHVDLYNFKAGEMIVGWLDKQVAGEQG